MNKRNSGPSPTRRLVTLAQAGEYLSVDPRTVRRYVAEGQLTGYRLGKKMLRVDLHEIDSRLLRAVPNGPGSAI